MSLICDKQWSENMKIYQLFFPIKFNFNVSIRQIRIVIYIVLFNIIEMWLEQYQNRNARAKNFKTLKK